MKYLGSIFIAALSTTGLVACGGGGGDSPSPGGPSVSGVSVASATVRYGQSLLVTVNGAGLDAGVTVSSPFCPNAVLSSTPPNVSTASTAYFRCTVSGVGAGQVVVVRASDGATLASVAVDVAVPQVTLALGNGAGVTGTMVITLAPDKTPVTVQNFLGYVNARFYDGTIIHRVAPGFVVQGGGYLPPVGAGLPTLKPAGAPIVLEAGRGLSNVQFSIAMARAGNDANSATSQFFINLADNSASLDPSPIVGPGYAVFGAVTGGVSAVTAVATAPCSALPMFFLPAGECTPLPYMVVTSAAQTR